MLEAIPKHERIVAWADGADGTIVAVTPRGIWWPEGDGHRLIGWQYVDKAIWRDDLLTVVQADVVDDVLLVDRAPVSLAIVTPRDLPPTVRSRVETNVVRSEVQPVPGGSARFVARRIPGRDGVVWWARLEAGTRDDAQVRASVVARLEQFRSASR